MTILWLLFGLGDSAAALDLAVIVHPSVKQSEIRRNTLRAIFGMRMRVWSDDTPIKVFVLPDGDANHAHFCKDVLQVFPHQLRRAWDRGVYSGTGQAPTQVASEAELVALVSETPGAIGYSMRSSIDDQVDELPLQ